MHLSKMSSFGVLVSLICRKNVQILVKLSAETFYIFMILSSPV